MLNKLICLEGKISLNCIITAKFMWNQISKTASQDYWHTCFIHLPRFWATSPQPKQKTPKKSWIAIFQSAKSSIVQFLPINQKTNLHKSTFLFCFLNQCLVALSCKVTREGGQRRGSTLNLNKYIFKITYISTWKHEIHLLATWEIANLKIEFLK